MDKDPLQKFMKKCLCKIFEIFKNFFEKIFFSEKSKICVENTDFCSDNFRTWEFYCVKNMEKNFCSDFVPNFRHLTLARSGGKKFSESSNFLLILHKKYFSNYSFLRFSKEKGFEFFKETSEAF